MKLRPQLRNSMLEIEKLAKMSRDLAKVNQELEESRLMAVSDQARTATRLLLVSGQLEHTEQKLYDLTKELDDGQKDADQLRIERMKRVALQESEDASRLKIETLQDELQEVQSSERMLQQKLIMIQSKYETLNKRHDNLKRQQQELELARESKEALAWLKETTDRLCSPPLGGGLVAQQHIPHSRSSHGSAPISIHQRSPSSSSPPYPSSFIDPPLAAQNQLISLIKELATTNSTLRSELNEYRDLLQDSRNEVLALRSQVEDYEQGHAFESCCGSRLDDTSESYLTSQSAWSVMETSLAGLDAVSHIGTLGSIPGSPPPYMTTPTSHHRRHPHHRHHSHHHHHHHHRHHLATGIRGNVFGELESFYSQTGGQNNTHFRPTAGMKKTKQPSISSRHGGSSAPSLADTIPSDPRAAIVAGPSSSSALQEFEPKRSSVATITSAQSPLNPTPSTFERESVPSPASHRMSLHLGTSLNIVTSGSESEYDNDAQYRRSIIGGPPDDTLHETMAQSALDIEPPFHESSLAAEMQLAQQSEASPSFSPGALLLPPANLKDAFEKNEPFDNISETDDSITMANRTSAGGTMSIDTVPIIQRSSSVKNRTSSISLLSAELQKATRSDSRIDLSLDGQQQQQQKQQALAHQEAALRRLEGLPDLDPRIVVDDIALERVTGMGAVISSPERKSFQHHEKSLSDQGLSNWRQHRRLSEPLHQIVAQNSMTTKKSRPGSIYSIRRPRPVRGSPDVHCIHSGHYSSASLGAGGGGGGGGGLGLPELQRCKSAELVEQLMTERRNRVMEAWRVGVVAAAVTQQQSIHSIVAFGDQRKDSDNISVRSKMSKMSRMSRSSRMSKNKRRHGNHRKQAAAGGRTSSGDQDSDTKRIDLASGAVSTTAALISDHGVRSSELLATTTDNVVMEETEDESVGQGTRVSELLTVNTAAPATTGVSAQEGSVVSDAQDSLTPTGSLRRGPRTPKGKKRQSLLSPRSSRSPLTTRSPMARASLLAPRDRRFPSEASTASEAFSNRRHDQEHSPYQLLHTLSSELLERLARSDTREMNRRLKRTFDIHALSQMSNSVIENVLTDVSNLNERFRWVETQAMDEALADDEDDWSKALSNKDKNNKTKKKTKSSSNNQGGVGQDNEAEPDSGSESSSSSSSSSSSMSSGSCSEVGDWDFSVDEFFPLAHVVQEMLSEIGKLRMTINELQLSYVQKVEQDRIRAEKDFMDTYGSDADDAMYEGDDDLGPLERIERAAPEKSSAQLKNVLGMLDRPKLLGTASTGMSGFFNKVFGGNNSNNNSSNGGNNQNRNQNQNQTQNQTQNQQNDFGSTAMPDRNSMDKPSMSKIKSGIVVAETSRVFAESAWISSPGNIPEPRTPKAPARSSTQSSSSSSAIIGGALLSGPKLSATTSLAAMATMSPVRSNTLPILDKSNNATSSPIMARSRAMDITFSPGTSQARSPPHSPTAASSLQGLFSRSLPKNQFFGAFSATVSNVDTSTTQHAVASSTVSRSSHASSVVESLEGIHSHQHQHQHRHHHNQLPTTPGAPSGASISQSKPPRSVGLSTRVSGPALNVLTKTDVFPEQWTTSTSSSLSASVSTVPSTATSDGRIHQITTGDGFYPGVSEKVPRSSSASVASSSTGAEVSSASSLKPTSKPTLITRASLTAATPSTSTVSSPMSATSWFDSRRTSGGLSAHLEEEDGSMTTAAVAIREAEGSSNTFTSGSNTIQGTDVGVSTTSTATTTGATIATMTTTGTSKDKAKPSFHSIAASGGSSESLTRSLGRASGRESALAFLKRENPASAMLGSFFQNQNQSTPSLSHNFFAGSTVSTTATATATAAAIPSTKATATATLSQSSASTTYSKGKGVVSIGSRPELGEYTKPGLEVLDDQEYDGERAVEQQEQPDHRRPIVRLRARAATHSVAIEAALADAAADHDGFSRSGLSASRSEVVFHSSTAATTGSVPATSSGLSQRAVVGSTAVAYVVAVPDSHLGETDYAYSNNNSNNNNSSKKKKRAVFDRELIKASQKRILASVGGHQENKPEGFVPVSGKTVQEQRQRQQQRQQQQQRPRALSVDSVHSSRTTTTTTEPSLLKQNEIMDLWRVGAGVSRDIWNGLIKKVERKDIN
ncbi:hypothetical protein BG004_002233 [Podila humilis]|nr:hypothetical protein BG004_002233 [Podila humilis]